MTKNTFIHYWPFRIPLSKRGESHWRCSDGKFRP